MKKKIHMHIIFTKQKTFCHRQNYSAAYTFTGSRTEVTCKVCKKAMRKKK